MKRPRTMEILGVLALLTVLATPVAADTVRTEGEPVSEVKIRLEASTYVGELSERAGYKAIPITTPAPQRHAALIVLKPGGVLEVRELDDWAVNGAHLVATDAEPELQLCGIRQGAGWECQLQTLDGRVRWSSTDLPSAWVESSRDLRIVGDRWWLLGLRHADAGQIIELRTGLVSEVPRIKSKPRWSVLISWDEIGDDVRAEFPQLVLADDSAEVEVIVGQRTFVVSAERGLVDQRVERGAGDSATSGLLGDAWKSSRPSESGGPQLQLPASMDLDWRVDHDASGSADHRWLIIQGPQNP